MHTREASPQELGVEGPQRLDEPGVPPLNTGAAGLTVSQIETAPHDLLTNAPQSLTINGHWGDAPKRRVDVSLAEKGSAAVAPVRALHNAPTPSIDNILRLALNGTAGRGAGERATGDVDFKKAVGLLDRATTAIAHLTARRDELEQAAAARETFYADKVRQLQEQASEWERRAKVIKAQLSDNEMRLSENQARLEALGTRAEQAEARAAVAEQQSAEARRQLQAYHDKIVETFSSLA